MSLNENELKEIVKKFQSKLDKIKICLFDVDGILTDGKIYWASEEVGFNRSFHTHDGYGMKILMKAGIKVGVITGGDSIGVEKRLKGLGLDYIYMGNEDKRDALNEIISKENVSDENILYMGDEFFDLPLLKRAGFSASVPNASYEIKNEVDYITTRTSGDACVREVIDILRYAKSITPEIEY